MNLNRLNFLMLSLLLGFLFVESKANTNGLPLVTINGDNGGLCGGAEWKSNSLEGKVNLVLYVDPDKQSWIKPLVTKLDSMCYAPDSLGITFILNTDATIIPDFIIRNRVREKAKKASSIAYVLDRNKLLVKKWNLIDDNVNVLLLDASGKIIQQHDGQMTKDYINQFITKINQSIKKGDLK